MAVIYCGHCGSDMPEDTAFCMACGASTSTQSEGSQPSAQPPQTTQPQHPPPQPQYGQPPQYPQYPQQYPQQPQYPQYPQQYPQQTYYQQPQYPPPQPTRSGSGAGRVLAYIALACVGIAAVGALVVMGFTLFKPESPNGGGGIVQSEPDGPRGGGVVQPQPNSPSTDGGLVQWQATYDQNRVLDEFGPPQAFVIGYGEDHLDQATGDDPLAVHRVEAWDYWEMQTRFEFKDGIAIGTRELPPLDGPVYTPEYSPLDFSLGMSAEQVAGLMQVGPSATATLDQELFPGMSIDSFFDELCVSYQEGGLVGVESSLLSLEGGS